MQTIAVILPINNPNILKQADLDPYNTSTIKFKLYYVDTPLKEIVTAEDVATVDALIIKKAHEVTQLPHNTAAVIVYAFGEFDSIKKAKQQSFPVPLIPSLGTIAIPRASQISQKYFTVIPGMKAHNPFFRSMATELGHDHNYSIAEPDAPELTPDQIRREPSLLNKLEQIANNEIIKNNIDTFTLGCGSFIGVAAKLEQKLRAKHGNNITVIDPVDSAIEYAKQAISK